MSLSCFLFFVPIVVLADGVWFCDSEYNTTHWLSQYYDLYSRPRGSGFVTCEPTIYIRKGTSLVSALKRSASSLVGRPRTA